MSSDGRRRPGRLEILGAWLRLWTPPRDAEIPPVPWRWVAAGAVLVAALVVVVVVAVAPSIEGAKRETEAREERRLDTALRERAARVRREQRPRFGRVAFVRGATGGPAPAGRPGARRAILRRIEAAVTRDARARHAAGELPRRALSTGCVLFPPRAAGSPAPPPRRREAYDCLAVTTTIARNERDRRAGSLGYPFRAIVDFGRATWAFCKINPVAGERVIPDPRRIVELPGECKL